MFAMSSDKDDGKKFVFTFAFGQCEWTLTSLLTFIINYISSNAMLI